MELLTCRGPVGPLWVVEVADGKMVWSTELSGRPVCVRGDVLLVSDGDDSTPYVLGPTGPVRISKVGNVEGVSFYAGNGLIVAVKGCDVKVLSDVVGPVSVCRDAVVWLASEVWRRYSWWNGGVEEADGPRRGGPVRVLRGSGRGGRFDVVGWEAENVCYFEVEGRFAGDIVLYEGEDGSVHRLELVTPSLILKLAPAGLSTRGCRLEVAAPSGSGGEAWVLPVLPLGRRCFGDSEGGRGGPDAVSDVDDEESRDARL